MTTTRTIRLTGLLLVYFALGAVLLPFYRFHIAPDWISYLSIAREYAAGDFAHAINGYWGPLTSWLLAPLLLLGLPSVIAGKILMLLVGGIILIGAARLAGLWRLSNTLTLLCVGTLIPAVLFFALVDFAPDILLACVILLYLNIIFRDDYARKASSGIWCGVLGALAYFCKQYGFMFFAAHFIIFSLLLLLRCDTSRRRRRIALNFLSGFLVFLVLSGAWSALISHKYHTFTLGTAGGYNQSLNGPASPGHVHHTQGLLPLPNETAVSAWEDPSYFPYTPWSPFESREALTHEAEIAAENLTALIEVGTLISVFSWAILLGVVLICIRPVRKLLSGGKEWYPLLAAAIFSGGYILILVDLRFFSLVEVLLVIMGGIVLDRMLKADFFTFTRQVVLLTAFAISFMIYPAGKLISHLNTGKAYHELSARLAPLGISGRLASNEQWFDSLYLASLLNGQYLGKVRSGLSDENLLEQLDHFNIAYYLVWSDAEEPPEFPDPAAREVTHHSIPGLWIYALNPTR